MATIWIVLTVVDWPPTGWWAYTRLLLTLLFVLAAVGAVRRYRRENQVSSRP